MDCAGECGGSAVVDVCGDCGGSGLNAAGCCGDSTDCIHYLDDIQSIFTDNCISCLEGSHVASELDLRTYTSLMAGSKNGAVIVESNHSNSLLWQKVSSSVSTVKMPPSGNLTAAQIALISTWIDEGALETTLSIIPEGSLYPHEFSVIGNFPNPFNPATTIMYGLPENSNVHIVIFDISGKQIQSLKNGFHRAGYHSIIWDASSYSSGMYLAKMITDNYISTQKLILVK